MDRISVVLAIFALAFCVAALMQHQNYLTKGEPPPSNIEERNEHIRSSVERSIMEIRECLARDPNEWCDRDMTPQRLAAFHGRLFDEVVGQEIDGPRQSRNRFLLFSAISAMAFLFRWKSKKNNAA